MITGRQISLKTASDANVTSGTLTFRGVSSGNLVIDLSIPGVSLNVSNLVVNATTTQADGTTVGFTMNPAAAMSYLTMGTWRYFTASGVTGFDGAALTGYQTQAGHVPTSGSATYIGVRGAPQGDIKAGGVTGTIWYPPESGPALISSGVSGNATLNINFGTGSVAGQLTNMTVGTGSGGSAAWNDVNLSGSLSGASMSGTTSTPGPAAGAGFSPPAMSSAATGTFKGALYGPSANEVGAIWTLFETANGGKSAVGVIAATHQ